MPQGLDEEKEQRIFELEQTVRRWVGTDFVFAFAFVGDSFLSCPTLVAGCRDYCKRLESPDLTVLANCVIVPRTHLLFSEQKKIAQIVSFSKLLLPYFTARQWLLAIVWCLAADRGMLNKWLK